MSTILKSLIHSRNYCIFFKKTVSVNFKFKTKQTNFNSKNTNMQRWWFLDEPAKHGGITSQSITRSKKTGVGVFDRKWTFKVLVTKQLYANEKIAVVGDCESLGAWNPEDAILLNQTDDNSLWSQEINIPSGNEIRYRYFVCSVDEVTQGLHVRRWETHLKPRIIPAISQNGDRTESIDTFGDINGVEKIDRGWLTSETILQFKFFNNPFKVKEKLKNKILFVKLTAMNLRLNAESNSNVGTVNEESLSNDTRENVEQPAYAFTEVVSLKYINNTLEPQPQFGQAYIKDDFIIFHVTVAEPENVAYLIDLYTYSSRASPDEPPYHLGYQYILPNVFKKCSGAIDIPITCASKHRPLGMMSFEYLKITPLPSPQMDMKMSFIRHWNRKLTGLDVGHRGSGTSFKANDGGVIRENTIASLKKAGAHGADMVEFDVQLSKDLVPVIYHDFNVYVSLKKKKTLEEHDMLELPMMELTLEQLKNLKVYHVVEGRNREPKFFDEDLDDHQPFPTLAEAMKQIDLHVGFNIEIKSSQLLIDGSMEAIDLVAKNLYIDCILETVLTNANGRRIVFSCFDADICTMLRYKQNLYPVMFLTLGVTDKYPNYHDSRCNTIERAVQFACATELLGIVAHTEDLLRDNTQIKYATDEGLVIFCWGDDNNCKDTIKQLKQLGIHAIIYDKMDILSGKETKESIFLVASKSSENELLKVQKFELERIANI